MNCSAPHMQHDTIQLILFLQQLHSRSKTFIKSLFCSPLSQAFIMAFTSDMIPRMVYLYAYSKGANMRGYVNNSLSIYNISQIPEDNMPEEQDYWFDNSTTTCRY